MKTPSRTWQQGVIMLLLTLCLEACLDAPPAKTSAESSSPTLYAAGFYQDGGKRIPCYWVESRKIDLRGDGLHDAQANCVFVPLWGVVYTAGYFSDGNKQVPCRWTGTARTDLPCSAGGEVFSIYVSPEGWPYAAGYYLGHGGAEQIPCYWAGTTRVDLPRGGEAGSALSIVVSDGKVYTAGYYQLREKLIPCYWVGTVRTDLPCGTQDGEATSILVSKGVVYTAGSDGVDPCYWKGTAETLLLGRRWVTSIDVSGGKVYTTGQSTAGDPCYWAETSENDLQKDATQTSVVYSVSVLAGKVFTAGVHYDGVIAVPCFWTDSLRTDFPATEGGKIKATYLK